MHSQKETPPLLASLNHIEALIIGIKEYKHEDWSHGTTGAENDATRFKQILTERMGVSEDHITMLLNKDASRDNIINGLKRLAGRENITDRDEVATVIFYAGHGAREVDEDPNGWKTLDEHVEMLCPYDMSPSGTEEKDLIPGIPDYIVAALLREIAAAKGNNITVFLDCCYAADLTRLPIRQIFNPPKIPPNHDSDILPLLDDGPIATNLRKYHLSAGFSDMGNHTHVLMAACGRGETSQQIVLEGGISMGYFTYVLLRHLDDISFISKNTYTTLAERMKLPALKSKGIHHQTPSCSGEYVNRLLFRYDTPQDVTSAFFAKRTRLHGGSVHGFQIGDVFELCSWDDLTVRSSYDLPSAHATGEIYRLKATTCDLRPLGQTRDWMSSNKLPNFHATRSSLAQLSQFRVWGDDLQQLEKIVKADIRLSSNAGIVVVEAPEEAHFKLVIGQRWITFRLTHPFNHHQSVPLTNQKLDAKTSDDEQLLLVITSAAKFMHHLLRSTSGAAACSSFNVDVIFHKVERHPTREGYVKRQEEPPHITRDGLIDITAVQGETWGLTLYNRGQLPLYPYIYYFDPSHLQISEVYHPDLRSPSDRVEEPLQVGSVLPIGYGSGGVRPLNFRLGKDETKDVGYIRVFLTTQPTSMMLLRQQSPFGKRAAPKRNQSEANELPVVSEATSAPNTNEVDLWDVKTLVIIQRKRQL